MTARIEHIGDATVYLGDCREFAAELVADAVISDPPYGISYVKKGGRRWQGKQASRRDRLAGKVAVALSSGDGTSGRGFRRAVGGAPV